MILSRQLVLSPAAFVVFAYLWVAPWRDRNRWRFLPPRNTAIVIGWAVAGAIGRTGSKLGGRPR